MIAMSFLTEQFDHFGTTSHLMSSAETYILACSQCNRPMRLKRVLPSILREVGIAKSLAIHVSHRQSARSPAAA
jgi:hypothetical protein